MSIFTKVQMKRPDSNRFDLSHDVKMSGQMGELLPTCVMEVLPGDKVNISVENLVRFAPLIAPVMHRVNVTTHYFFVPNRILWDGWESFITRQTESVHPFVQNDAWEQGTLADYMGFPVQATLTNERYNALPIAAYTKIWDEYYRDQNLQSERFTPLIDGDNSITYNSILNSLPFVRAWMHDYFTSCLPTAQKGDPVSIPLTNEENIPVDYQFNTGGASQNVGRFRDTAGNLLTATGAVTQGTGPSPLTSSMEVNGTDAAYDPNGTLSVDVQSQATDINTLRWAFRLQEWLEKNMRGGTRYVENLLVHFGVRSQDARLQRPEYIGGTRGNMVISEVLSTAETVESSTPVGQMAGHGIAATGGNSFNYYAQEHGFIIGIINVQPTTAYQQGIHKMYSRETALDYAWPTFANLGEQAVLNKEVYAPHSDPNGTFGYIPRYSEYKYMNNRVAGDMHTNLSFWHLGRIFANDVALNESFIQCYPDTRIFAVENPELDHLFMHIFNNITVNRKLPRYGIPSI